MPSNIAMAPHSGAKLLPMLPATAKPKPPTSLLPSSLSTSSASTLQQLVASTTSSSSSTAVLSKSLLATASSLAATSTPTSSSSPSSVSTISIPVSAFHDPNSNVITITPYIFLKTATVAEQMQALRQDKKLPKQSESAGTTGGALRVKRRADISSKLGLPDAKPASVSRRNARERNRVKQVNLGFETLREHVPNGKKNKKMSKVQTLRSAAQYIKDLYMILHGELPELGSPADIDETEPTSPLDNSMCSVSDTDDFNEGSPEQQQQQPQQQQVHVPQRSEQLLLQQQENMMQQDDHQDQMLQEREKQLLHRPQQFIERQLIRMQQQLHQDDENQQPQQQMFNQPEQQQMFQTQNLLNAQEPMETSESSSITAPPSVPVHSPIFRDTNHQQDTEMQVESSHQMLQRQLQSRQQQQFSQLQQQKELQQKLLRQHQEQQRKKQLLQLQKEEKQQQQQQLEKQQQQQQEKRQIMPKPRPQKQRSAQIRQKQQPLILKKESVSVLQQQLNRGNITQLQRLQAHLQEQAQQQQQVSSPPSAQNQQNHNDHHKQQLIQQVNLDPSALRTEAMTCTSTNYGFSRSTSTSSDGQLPDTPLSAFAASGNVSVSANSPLPGSPLIYGTRRSTGTGNSPLPGTPVTFTELSPVSLDDDQCENYMSLSNTGPLYSNSLQNQQQLQNTNSDFVGVDQSGSMQQFRLNTSGQNLSQGCADNNLSEIPTSPSMLQPATYISDSNMNTINSPPPNPTDFEALHTYYKAIHTEHFIKNMDDDVFVLEPRNVLNNNVINSNNNNNPETANNNILNTSSHNNSITNNNSSIAAILNNHSNIVNTLLNNSSSVNNFGSYLNTKNNNNITINSKLTHSPAPSVDSNSSIISSDVDLTITGNNYHTQNNNSNINSDGCYDDNGANDLETYENLDGDALQDISNWISELCSQGLHGTDIGHIQQMAMAYSH